MFDTTKESQRPKVKKPKMSVMYPILLTKQLQRIKREKNITAEDFRRFIKSFDKSEIGIKSDDWQTLRDILEKSPSLQLVGNIGAGKSYLVKQLVSNDKKHVYIVMDAHNEFEDLETYTTIPDRFEGNIRIKLPKEIAAAKPMFDINLNLLVGRKYPDHYVVVVEEAIRYKDIGLRNLMAESRKFIKVLAVMQELSFDFCPSLRVIPYN